MAEPARVFPPATKSVRGEEPLLVGFVGPPGGGKTVSSLRLAMGMKTVRGGPVVLIDTEGGRSKKYSDDFDFLRVDFPPPFRSQDFLTVIRQQLPLKPSAIIVDSLSDEHEGEGGYLEWHDAIAAIPAGQPGNVGGNEWAAWAKPKAARKRLISGLLQIKVPLLFTFRAREKTEQKTEDGKRKVINLGWMPVAPLEIVHALDLTCILPPRADGVPVWTSTKLGEDFIVKLPRFLQSCIRPGPLSEETGAALAQWALGNAAPEGVDRATLLRDIQELIAQSSPGPSTEAKEGRLRRMEDAFGVRAWKTIQGLPVNLLVDGLAKLRHQEPSDQNGEDIPDIGDPGPPPEGTLDDEAINALRAKAGAHGVTQEFEEWMLRQFGDELVIPAIDKRMCEDKIQDLARAKKRGH